MLTRAELAAQPSRNATHPCWPCDCPYCRALVVADDGPDNYEIWE